MGNLVWKRSMKMTYENSGSKNEIAGLLKLTGVLVFGMWNDKYKQPRFIENAAQEELYQKFLRLIDRGKINEAENEMLAYIEDMSFDCNDIPVRENISLLDFGLSVYGYMNEKEDIFLKKHHYSREEIEEGIHDLLIRFGKEAIAAR